MHDGRPVNANSRDNVDLSDVKEAVSKFAKKHFPGVEPEPALEEYCMYTVSEIDNFYNNSVSYLTCLIDVTGFSPYN